MQPDNNTFLKLLSIWGTHLFITAAICGIFAWITPSLQQAYAIQGVSFLQPADWLFHHPRWAISLLTGLLIADGTLLWRLYQLPNQRWFILTSEVIRMLMLITGIWLLVAVYLPQYDMF
ncbi:MAG: hypothetical protein KTR14_05935 [Vampirovibrio sp.]|nr:hypothetical protein [Vampirovibrio sp.]